MTRILYYISGHGFGHAARSAEVIRALGEHDPDIRVLVATSAPKRLFRNLPAIDGDVIDLDIGTGVVEGSSSLCVDRDATVARLTRFLEGAEQVVAREVTRIRQENISLIVADVPYLAGEIAHQARVASVAIGNFTWDWIYKPYLADSPNGQALLARIQEAYHKMSCYLRLPLSHDTDTFQRTVDVPLITRSVRTSPDDTLQWLGVEQHDPRRRVLYAMRDTAYLDSLSQAAETMPDRLFLYFGAPGPAMPENTQAVALDDRITFPDVLNVCDTVVSKLGYGTLADCIATRTPILYPPRFDFREDEVFAPIVPQHFRARQLSLDDFKSGNWLPHLQQLETLPQPPHSLPANGAATCAKILTEMCHQRKELLSPDSTK